MSLDLFAGIPVSDYTAALAWYEGLLDTRVAAITDRGLHPTNRETYSNGVRKITYHDPDGNEIGLGGGPAST
ncbi:hypothetical protein [Streptomyces sp. NPDC001536]|uniref:hypothetical protein n=1 Tax=Streptomyces sp. NPDC001536 TaxID=3364583 RepID=UPI0036AD2148